MSMQEIRQNIINENIKKLIESLTSFTVTILLFFCIYFNICFRSEERL